MTIEIDRNGLGIDELSEKKALYFLAKEEAVICNDLAEVIGLYSLLTRVFAASRNRPGTVEITLEWEVEAINISCGVNDLATLKYIRLRVHALNMYPAGWTVYFELRDHSFPLDSITFAHPQKVERKSPYRQIPRED